MNLQADSADGVYYEVMRHVLDYGDIRSPRGVKTQELTGVKIELTDPACNVITSPVRRLSYTFMVAEFLWMILGRNDVASVSRYNKKIADFSDDGHTFYGAYGPKIVDQLEYVIRTLTRDPDSRQAVMTIWRESPGQTLDVPCTIMFQFMIRDQRLQMIAYMRSNDVWLGFPYDLFNFTMIQQYVAGLLGVKPGKYTHMVGSLHMYWENRQQCIGITEDEPGNGLRMPQRLDGPIAASVPTYYYMLSDPKLKEIIAEEPIVILSEMDQFLTAPWNSLMRVLAYASHKNRTLLSSFWKEVYHRARPQT